MMKKYISIILLFITLASCNNNNPVNNTPVTNSFDDIILTKNPHDSALYVYGLNLGTMKQRYITDKGFAISNVYNNKVLLANMGYFYLRDIYLYDIKTNLYNSIPIGSDYPVYISLSPDASKLLYTTDAGDMLVVLNSDGTNRRVFSTVMSGRETLAEFSPDGKKIAFVERNPSAIYTIDTSGNNKFKVTDISEQNSGAKLAWSPDGKTITFVRMNTSNFDNIWKINVDGSGLVNLTNYVYHESNPIFSPDGQYIAYMQYGYSGIPDVVYMKSDGSNKINLNNTPTEYETFPSWSPDGKKIMYHTGSGGSYRFLLYDLATQTTVQADTAFTAYWNYTK